ncbi:MAG TPA: LacI family DNA-binding transcriptional regulator [Phototrophicaceae bacterium]|nr:LacI family DNA-binding transcriptional regulator [Phototrophicaceae bacterium]
MNHGLETIAEIAGVSKSTVSRVINDQPNVSAKTRQRVLEAIQQSGYRPNQAARALVTRQTGVLSIVIPQAVAATFTDPYFPALIQSITLTANEHNYAIMLWVGNNAEEEERYCDRILKNGFFDGMIIASAVDNDPLLQRLVGSKLPYVLIGPPQAQVEYSVDVDNRAVAHEAVSHLLSLGYQRVGTITGPLHMGVSRCRLQGYYDAFEQTGVGVDETLVAHGNYDESSGYTAMTTLIERGTDAVFCASDTMALGALRALLEAHLRVPEDVALVGFDDMPFAATSHPPLTTVHQPIDELGRTATNLLISLIEGAPIQTHHLVLTAHLIIRHTCGAAKIA